MKVNRLERLTQKVGGRFRLTSLLQKRLAELVNGSPPLVDTAASDYFEIALSEIEEGRIEILRPWNAEGAESLPASDGGEGEAEEEAE